MMILRNPTRMMDDGEENNENAYARDGPTDGPTPDYPLAENDRGNRNGKCELPLTDVSLMVRVACPHSNRSCSGCPTGQGRRRPCVEVAKTGMLFYLFKF